jgi:hypothetical protein
MVPTQMIREIWPKILLKNYCICSSHGPNVKKTFLSVIYECS